MSAGPQQTNLSEIQIKIQTFPFKEKAYEMAVYKILTILILPQFVRYTNAYIINIHFRQRNQYNHK